MFDLFIVLITYNRAGYLRRTLGALAFSVFRDCDTCVRINASAEDALRVCQSFQSGVSHMHIVTHRFNNGGNGNSLRGNEYGLWAYTWMSCDDHTLFLGLVDGLAAVLQGTGFRSSRCALVVLVWAGGVALFGLEPEEAQLPVYPRRRLTWGRSFLPSKEVRCRS
jgi:hypothetical protein